jgi:hypothetical protein
VEEEMTTEQEYKLKYMAEQMQSQGESRAGSTVGRCDANSPERASLRIRVQEQWERSNREGRRARAMEELGDLLDKHPEVGRIVELLEEM